MRDEIATPFGLAMTIYFMPLYHLENNSTIPSPLAGEGAGEGDYTVFTPTSILPHQGGG